MKSFNEIYEQIYTESNEELQILKRNRIIKILIALIIGILTLLVLNKIIDTAIPFVLITIMIILITGVVISKEKYTPTFKEKAIKPLIKNIDMNLKYNPKGGIPSAIYQKGEFEKYDNYHSEDEIEGMLDGKCILRMAEVLTEEESTDSEGRTQTFTIFHGIFGNIEATKNIGTTLKVRSDKGKFGGIFKGKTKIDMDSAEFEKYFDIYAENRIVAMQILTADVMEMMIDFIKTSEIKYELTIKENQIYIRFHTGNVFEPKMFKDVLDYNMLKKYYDIITFIFNVTRAINEAIENTEI